MAHSKKDSRVKLRFFWGEGVTYFLLHVSSVCGKAENITLKKAVSSTRWPWQAAIYRTASGVKENSLRKGAWILICSGALVNERTVVVAAHCVTDLGKTIVLKTAELKVVLGKFYRDDDRDEKTIQNLRVSEPNRSEK